MNKYISIAGLLACLFTSSCASANPEVDPWVAGQDYELLPPQAIQSPASDSVEIVEFFSYGCPWCGRIEPAVARLMNHLGPSVRFKRVPVVFEAGWDQLAKAYYTAEALHVLDRIHPLLFEKVQTGQFDFKQVDAIQDLFVKAGVTPERFQDFFHSFSVATAVQQGKKLFETYQLYATPVFVVNGRYKTDLQHAKGQPERLIQIMEGLLKKPK